jgi:hypothetical protein
MDALMLGVNVANLRQHAQRPAIVPGVSQKLMRSWNAMLLTTFTNISWSRRRTPNQRPRDLPHQHLRASRTGCYDYEEARKRRKIRNRLTA